MIWVVLLGGTALGQTEERQKVTWEEYWRLEARLRAGAEKPMESLSLGDRRQLFVDNYVIEHLENVEKVLHQPRKHPDNPLLRPERPWRGPRERTLDTQLALSRDGLTWWRAGDRQTFMPLGSEGSWDRFSVAPNNSPPIRRGEELWIYYHGGSERHRAGPTPAHRRREPWLGPGHPEDPPLPPGVPHSGIGLARLRVDGFVSIDAGPRPGRILTRPLLFQGQELHANVDAGGGSLRAELYHAERVPAYSNSPSWGWAIREPLRGFSFQDCRPLQDDTTDGVLRWEGGDLGGLAGQPIVIRFELVQASLFSFWVR